MCSKSVALHTCAAEGKDWEPTQSSARFCVHMWGRTVTMTVRACACSIWTEWQVLTPITMWWSLHTRVSVYTHTSGNITSIRWHSATNCHTGISYLRYPTVRKLFRIFLTAQAERHLPSFGSMLYSVLHHFITETDVVSNLKCIIY